MWHSQKVTSILAEPVTLAEAQRQCSITEDDFTSQLEMLISAGRSHVERYCNAAFAVQKARLVCSGFGDLSRLPMSPVSYVTSLAYVDVHGQSQVVPAAVYEASDDGGTSSIVLVDGHAWPEMMAGSRITVDAVFGGAVPADVKHAVLIYIFTHFEKRDDDARPSFTAIDALLSNHRRGAW